MRITKVLDCVYEQSVGWNPSSGAIKPVHIANGLFRDLLKKSYKTEKLVKFAVAGRKGKEPMPERTFESLVMNIDTTRFKEFADFADPNRKKDFERLRESVRGLLAADGAVFPEASASSLTLTCPQMISSDFNDRNVGRFMAAILRGSDPNVPGKLGQVVERALTEGEASPCDPISFLVWPLLSQEASPQPKDNIKIPVFGKKQFQSFVAALTAAADQLAEHELAQDNRLATFQRSIHFTCLALLAHVQALSVGGKMDARVPLLLTMDAAKGSRLAKSSEQTVVMMVEKFESWLGSQLADRLKAGQPLFDGDDKKDRMVRVQPVLPDKLHRGTIRAWLKQFSDRDGDTPTDAVWTHRLEIYDEVKALREADGLHAVLGETLARCYFDEYDSGGPSEFIRGVATRAGILFPHGQGRSRDKRVRPSVQILDALVRACTPTGGSVPFEIFLDRLWERFGIIVGGRVSASPTDLDLLQHIGIDVSPTDLHENCLSLVNHLVEIGLARRYPDNVAYVGKYHA